MNVAVIAVCGLALVPQVSHAENTEYPAFNNGGTLGLPVRDSVATLGLGVATNTSGDIDANIRSGTPIGEFAKFFLLAEASQVQGWVKTSIDDTSSGLLQSSVTMSSVGFKMTFGRSQVSTGDITACCSLLDPNSWATLSEDTRAACVRIGVVNVDRCPASFPEATNAAGGFGVRAIAPKDIDEDSVGLAGEGFFQLRGEGWDMFVSGSLLGMQHYVDKREQDTIAEDGTTQKVVSATEYAAIFDVRVSAGLRVSTSVVDVGVMGQYVSETHWQGDPIKGSIVEASAFAILKRGTKEFRFAAGVTDTSEGKTGIIFRFEPSLSSLGL